MFREITLKSEDANNHAMSVAKNIVCIRYHRSHGGLLPEKTEHHQLKAGGFPASNGLKAYEDISMGPWTSAPSCSSMYF